MYPWMLQEENMTITILSTDLLRIQATGDDMIYLQGFGSTTKKQFASFLSYDNY